MRYEDPDTPFAILIASRNLETRTSVAALFPEPEYRVVLAADGKDAFDKAKNQHFDLVITGIVMGKLDGLELLNALRQLDSSRPIIMVAEGNGEIEKVYLRCAALIGAVRTFEYPLDPLIFYRNARAVILQSRLHAGQKV